MAATHINRVVLTGNLTRDPELRSLPSGISVCSLRVASNTRRKSADGEWVDKPNYFDVTVWGTQGENCGRFLAKGSALAVDGRLEWREFETRERTESGRPSRSLPSACSSSVAIKPRLRTPEAGRPKAGRPK